MIITLNSLQVHTQKQGEKKENENLNKKYLHLLQFEVQYDNDGNNKDSNYAGNCPLIFVHPPWHIG